MPTYPAMPVLSSNSTTQGNSNVNRTRIHFDDNPTVFEHTVDQNMRFKPVGVRHKKKKRFLPVDYRGDPSVLQVAQEDASIAAQHLQNAVDNELHNRPAGCGYLCFSLMGCVKCFKPVNSPSMATPEIAWIADNGSAHDLVSRNMLHDCEVSQSSRPVSLLTANGVFQAVDQAKVDVPVLGTQITPYVLDESPAVVSVGQRCIDADWSFHWRSVGLTSRSLMAPRSKVKLEVQDYVPYLPSTTGMAMTAIGQPYGSAVRSGEPVPMIPLPSAPAEEVVPVDDDEDNPIGEDPVEEDEVVLDERLVAKPLDEKRDRGARALKEEATSIQHLLTHTPKNPFCDVCNRAKMTKRPSYRSGGSTQVEANTFGEHITADHLVLGDDEEMDIDGSRTALVIKDIATDFVYVYPSARRSTRECIVAFRHFVKSTDDVGVFYSDNSPELVAAAERLSWRHQKECRLLVQNKCSR